MNLFWKKSVTIKQLTAAYEAIRACTTQRHGVVSKRLESDIKTIKKTDYTTHRRRVVYKQFNALYIVKINHEYQFVYHCMAV